MCLVYCSRASTSVVTHEPYTYQSYKNAKERMVYRNECITVKRKEGRVEKKISLFKYAAGITVSTLFLDGFFSTEKRDRSENEDR